MIVFLDPNLDGIIKMKHNSSCGTGDLSRDWQIARKLRWRKKGAQLITQNVSPICLCCPHVLTENPKYRNRNHGSRSMNSRAVSFRMLACAYFIASNITKTLSLLN